MVPSVGDGSRHLLVVTPQASALQAQLEGALPDSITAGFYRSADAVPRECFGAQLAFGAPDDLARLLPSLRRLEWVQSTWAGVTPLLATDRQDYRLSNARGIFGDAMSEYVLGWLLALRRRILHRATHRRWDPMPDPGLTGLSLGIAGTGSIGAVVARRCQPFVSRVLGLNRSGRQEPAFASCFSRDRAGEFASQIDALVLLLPDTAETHALADSTLLDALRPGAIVINAGRANALVLDAALTRLRSGQLGALVLDVLETEPLPDDDPLWSEPGVYITSHTAAPTTVDAIAGLFLDNLQRFLTGEVLLGEVDFDRGY